MTSKRTAESKCEETISSLMSSSTKMSTKTKMSMTGRDIMNEDAWLACQEEMSLSMPGVTKMSQKTKMSTTTQYIVDEGAWLACQEEISLPMPGETKVSQKTTMSTTMSTTKSTTKQCTVDVDAWLTCEERLSSPPLLRPGVVVPPHRLTSSIVWPSSHCSQRLEIFSILGLAAEIRNLPSVNPSRNTPISNLADNLQYCHPLLNLLPDRGDRIGALVASNMPPDMHEVACDNCVESYIDRVKFDQWLDELFAHDRPYNSDPSRIVYTEALEHEKYIAKTKKTKQENKKKRSRDESNP